MTYEKLEQDLSAFDRTLVDLKLQCPSDCSLGKQLSLTREFLRDRRDLSEDKWLPKWQPQFQQFYEAQLVVARLADAVALLAARHSNRLTSYLKTIFAGDLTQSIEPNQAKDFLYELWLASTLLELGFEIALEEPDIVISENGLNAPIGIACKYPSSEKQIHPHLSKGYKQIRNQSLEGVVAVGLDLIVLRTAFPTGVRYIDFREGDKEPLQVVQKLIDEATAHLVTTRPIKHPSEDPVDGLLLTLTMGGILGNPAGLSFVSAMALQCDASNPLITDLSKIRDAFR